MENYRSALITGASSGIGATFAERLAQAGLDLVLVARSTDKLRALAKRLKDANNVRVEVISADLSVPGSGEALALEVGKRGMDVDLLINNAGFGTLGPFYKQDPARERQEVLLNAGAVVDVAHAFLPDMLERGRGGIINIASMAAFQPLPYMSVYAATKAFVLSFSEGLRGELRGKGVKVLCVCPGPVDTPFFEATGNPKVRKTIPKRAMMTVQDVVDESIKAFKAGRGVCVPGYANKAMAMSSRLMPRALMTAITSRVLKR